MPVYAKRRIWSVLHSWISWNNRGSIIQCSVSKQKGKIFVVIHCNGMKMWTHPVLFERIRNWAACTILEVPIRITVYQGFFFLLSMYHLKPTHGFVSTVVHQHKVIIDEDVVAMPMSPWYIILKYSDDCRIQVEYKKWRCAVVDNDCLTSPAEL